MPQPTATQHDSLQDAPIVSSVRRQHQRPQQNQPQPHTAAPYQPPQTQEELCSVLDKLIKVEEKKDKRIKEKERAAKRERQREDRARRGIQPPTEEDLAKTLARRKKEKEARTLFVTPTVVPVESDNNSRGRGGRGRGGRGRGGRGGRGGRAQQPQQQCTHSHIWGHNHLQDTRPVVQLGGDGRVTATYIHAPFVKRYPVLAREEMERLNREERTGKIRDTSADDIF